MLKVGIKIQGDLIFCRLRSKRMESNSNSNGHKKEKADRLI
jgi:hypothetical protein